MTYVSEINALIKDQVRQKEKVVAYGQNITAGSCLSGLTRGLVAGPEGVVLNTPNVENTLVGTGFGLLLKGWNAIYFMKQQDFLLLGLDHLVNTWNIIRQTNPTASFTVVSIIVDSGFEGPQSSLNNFADFCSFAHIPGWAITNRRDAAEIVNKHLVAPGFRLIGVSQRLFGTDMLDTETDPVVHANGDVLQYADGDEATIVAANFAFPQAFQLHAELQDKGHKAALFSLPQILPGSWDAVLDSAGKTKRLIVVDDSKSENRPTDRLMLDALRQDSSIRLTRVNRTFSEAMLKPNADRMNVETAEILDAVGLS